MNEVDDLFRAGAPPVPDGATVRRLAARAMAKLEERRRRRRAMACAAACAAAALLTGVFLRPHEVARPAPAHEQAKSLPVATARPPSLPAPPRRRVPKEPAPRVEETIESIELALLAEKSSAGRVRLFWRGWQRCTGARAVELLRTVLPELRPADLARIADEIRRGDLPESMATALGRSGASEAWPLLSVYLESRGPHVSPIEAAGELGDARAVPILKRWICLADGRAEAAASALGKIPGPDSLRALLFAFESTRCVGPMLLPALHEKISTALREREEELEAFLFQAEPAARALVFKALVELRTPATLATLSRALEEPRLRAEARRYLERGAMGAAAHKQLEVNA